MTNGSTVQDSVNNIKRKLNNPDTRRKIIVGAGLIVVILIVAHIFWLVTRPERSAANFCKVRKEEAKPLTFDSSDKETLRAYIRLEQVSPDGIRDDVEQMRKAAEKTVDDPSSSWGASWGTMGAGNRLNEYTRANCRE
jgi:hypothetical protein